MALDFFQSCAATMHSTASSTSMPISSRHSGSAQVCVGLALSATVRSAKNAPTSAPMASTHRMMAAMRRPLTCFFSASEIFLTTRCFLAFSGASFSRSATSASSTSLVCALPLFLASASFLALAAFLAASAFTSSDTAFLVLFFSIILVSPPQSHIVATLVAWA